MIASPVHICETDYKAYRGQQYIARCALAGSPAANEEVTDA